MTKTKSIGVIVLLGAIVLQVFVPALFDIVVSLVIGGAAGWIGYQIGKASKE